MPSRRDLKKDINNLCYDVINECFTFLNYSPSLNHENVHAVISDAVDLRNRLIAKVNHSATSNPSRSSTKAYYREIHQELHDTTIDLVERLNNLTD